MPLPHHRCHPLLLGLTAPKKRSYRGYPLYYDVENRWIGQTIDADGAGTAAALQVTAFAYHGTQIALQYEGTVADDGGRPAEALQAGDLTHRYLWGPAVDQILADEQVESLDEAGQVVWPLADPIGTVRDLVLRNAETGIAAVANHRVYDSFGNLQSQTSTAVDCLFGFTGRPFDTATGLQNNWNRWYDPELRRWASEDPIGLAGGDGNTARYCLNNVVSATDSTGLWSWENTVYGVTQIVGGVVEMEMGLSLIGLSLFGTVGTGGVGTPITLPVGIASAVLTVHGLDNVVAGIRTLVEGTPQKSYTREAVESLANWLGYDGEYWGEAVEFFIPLGASCLSMVRLPLGAARVLSNRAPIASSALRERFLANIAESQSARASSNFGAYVARESQALSGYSADAWSMTTLKPGSIVYGGVPGQSAFYTDFATVKASGLNSQSLFESLQVPPHPVYGYRPGIQAYRVTTELSVPGGSALNNPAFGAGGGQQFFIPNFNEALVPIRQFPLSK